MAKSTGHKLSGKTSDRIRSGEIPAATINPPRSMNPPPSADAVRHGSGQALGGGTSRDGTNR